MFSSIFYKRTFPNDEKIRKIMKESMDKYIRSLDYKYKSLPLIKYDFNTEKNNNARPANMISFLPFIIFGWGVYQLSKGIFIKR